MPATWLLACVARNEQLVPDVSEGKITHEQGQDVDFTFRQRLDLFVRSVLCSPQRREVFEEI